MSAPSLGSWPTFSLFSLFHFLFFFHLIIFSFIITFSYPRGEAPPSLASITPLPLRCTGQRCPSPAAYSPNFCKSLEKTTWMA
jgi:hypothetical protein